MMEDGIDEAKRSRGRLPIQYWIYGLVTVLVLPLLGILAWFIVDQERGLLESARQTALRQAESSAEIIRADRVEARRLLGAIAERVGSRPAEQLCDPLFGFVDLFPEYLELSLHTPEGGLICGTGSTFVSGTDLGVDTRVENTPAGWLLMTSTRVPREDRMLFITLVQRLALAGLPPDAVLTIIDAQGSVVARSIEPHRWQGVSLRGNLVTETVLRERKGTLQATGIDGVPRQYGFTHIAPLDWYLYVGLPTEPIMRPLRTRLERIAAAGLGVLILLGLTTTALSHRVSRPIRALGRATTESLDEVLRVTRMMRGPREVEDLATSIHGLITARRIYEQKLVESERQLRALSDRLLVVQEEERSKLSRAIHDDLGQAITALKMDVGGMRALAQRDPEQVRKLGLRVEATLDDLLAGIQQIAAELRPPSLDDLGLAAAIEQEAALFEERTGIECALSVEPRDIRIPRQVETVTFRIVQEALTNVARHSNASRVEIRLREREEIYLLDIRDDGRGISAEEAESSSSLGLIGIRERASLVGGEVSIEGMPGRGTIIVARLPRREEES